ncbi:hypothetical protein JOS77_08690 [Chromobacterium haemolyticum]|nr:hypothetical protein JOS77_08690 [Chromobacterium haemolyticum]
MKSARPPLPHSADVAARAGGSCRQPTAQGFMAAVGLWLRDHAGLLLRARCNGAWCWSTPRC